MARTEVEPLRAAYGRLAGTAESRGFTASVRASLNTLMGLEVSEVPSDEALHLLGVSAPVLLNLLNYLKERSYQPLEVSDVQLAIDFWERQTNISSPEQSLSGAYGQLTLTDDNFTAKIRQVFQGLMGLEAQTPPSNEHLAQLETSVPMIRRLLEILRGQNHLQEIVGNLDYALSDLPSAPNKNPVGSGRSHEPEGESN